MGLTPETRSLRDLAATRAPKLGTFLVEFATPGIGYALKAAGADFVLLDLEHSGFSIDRLKELLRFLEAARLPAIVGLPSRDPQWVAMAADMGAEGVMSPMVASAAEAAEALARLKYPPVGRRAVSVGVAHDRYRAGPVPEMLAAANRRLVYFAKIETVAGLEEVEAIAALDGVDGLWIGHYDLSASMGIPGRFDDPAFLAAAARIAAAAAASGRALGRLVGSVEEGIALHRAGFDFIGYSGDVWLLQEALSRAIAGIAAGIGDQPRPADR